MVLVRTAPWGRHGIAQNAFKNEESVCPYHASEPSVMWSGSAIESVSLSYTRASGSRLLPSRGFPRGVSGPFTALLFAPFRPHFPMPGTGGPTRGAKRHPLSQHSWRTVRPAVHRGRGAPGKPRWKRVSARGGRRQTQHEESLREAHLIGWRDTGFRYPGRTRPHDLGKDRLSALRPWHVNSLGESAIFHAQPSRHTLAGRDLDLDSEFCVLPLHDGHSVTVP